MKITFSALALIWFVTGCEKQLSPEELAVKEERDRCVKLIIKAGGGLNSGNLCDEYAIRRKHGL